MGKSKIKIKEKNKGRFTKSAKAAGKSVQEHAHDIMNNPNATALQRKRANFTIQAKKWHSKELGGLIDLPIADNGVRIPFTDEYGNQIPDDWGNNQQVFERIEPLTAQQGLPNGQLSTKNVEQPFYQNADVQSNEQGFNPDILKTIVQAGSQIEPLARGAWTSLGNAIKNKRTQAYEANQLNKALKPINTEFSEDMYGSNQGLQLFEMGGINNYKAEHGANVLVEDNELIQTDNGLAQTIYGDKHSDPSGGISMNLPPSSKVFSEKLKIPINGKKKSFSKIAKPFETKKDIENLNSPFSTKINKDTAELNIKLKNNVLDGIFEIQENSKMSGLFGKKVQQETINNYEMKYGGKLPKAQDGWINKILDFESTQGSASGTGLSNYGIKKDVWASKYPKMWEDDKITKEEAIEFIKQEYLPKVKDYPEEVQKRLVDYAYNTGRNIEDVLLLASGKTDLNSVQNKKTDFNLFNKEKANIIKNMSDPSFISKLDQAKSQIYQDTWSKKGTPDVFEATSLPRINMWNPNEDVINISSLSNQQSSPTPINNNSSFTGINLPKQKDLSWLKPFTSKTKEGQTTPTGVNLQSKPPQPTNWEGIASTWMDINPDIDSNIELQEEMYDYWLDKYQFGNPKEKSEATKQFKKLWGTFGDVKGNKPQGIAKNFKNWKPDDKSTYDDLARLRGNFMDAKPEARYLLPMTESQKFTSKSKTPLKDDEIKLQSRIKNKTDKTASDLNIPQFFPMGLPVIGGEEAAARFQIPDRNVPFRRISPQQQLNEINRNTRAGLSLLGNTPTDVSNISNLLTQANMQGQQAINTTNQQNIQNQMNIDQINTQLSRQRDLAQLQEDVRFTENIAKRKGLMQTEANMNKAAYNQNWMNILKEQRDKDFVEKIYPSKAWENVNFQMYDPTKYTLTPKEKKEKKEEEVKKYGGKIKLKSKSSK